MSRVEEHPKFNTTYISIFLLGIIAKEIFTFIGEGGLNGNYPLCRCLFYMFLALLAFVLLWLPRANRVNEGIRNIQGNFQGLQRLKRRFNLSEDEAN